MNKTIILPIIISVILSVSISYYLNSPKNKISVNNNGNISDNNLNTTATIEEPKEILSIKGYISEIKDNKYIINTEESLIFTVNINSKTVFGTSFAPTQEEMKTLYTTSTSTSNDKEIITKLNLNIGDHIQVKSTTNIKGKTEFTAEMIKLIR